LSLLLGLLTFFYIAATKTRLMRYLRLLLLPFSLVYATAAWVRNALYDSGLLRKHGFDVPVILVGNLTVGGTGKTPHVEYLIRLLKSKYRLATLSRGYGRKTKGCVLAGKGSTAEVIGDEPMQYHTKFPGITVGVCENRVYGITKMLGLPNRPQVIIMDDGYQHRSVDPDFRILLTSYDSLFTRDFVLPAGNLREPSFGYRRAQCIIVTRTPEVITEKEKEKIRREINPGKHQHLFFSSLVYEDVIPFSGNGSVGIHDLHNTDALLFTGIANPTALVHQLKRSCKSVDHISFPDHHPYTEKDMIRIRKQAGSGKVIFTTEKDYLRLKYTRAMEELKDADCRYIPIKVKIDHEKEFNKLVFQRVQNVNS
jgi:tetraacyldisaccharide 4'-kinase